MADGHLLNKWRSTYIGLVSKLVFQLHLKKNSLDTYLDNKKHGTLSIFSDENTLTILWKKPPTNNNSSQSLHNLSKSMNSLEQTIYLSSNNQFTKMNTFYLSGQWNKQIMMLSRNHTNTHILAIAHKVLVSQNSKDKKVNGYIEIHLKGRLERSAFWTATNKPYNVDYGLKWIN